MTIAEMRQRGKKLVEGVPRDVLVVAILILSSSASFGLGILAGRDGGEVGSDGFAVTQIPLATSTFPVAVGLATAPASIPAGGQVVASKNGTKYYLPWCGGAKNISDANKIRFASKEEAEAKGYAPAGNCKGL